MEQATSLRTQINRHDRLYYNQADPEISDQEYDNLRQELLRLEAEYPEISTANSPSQRVSGENDPHFNKVEHSTPMLSLGNAFNQEQFLAWQQRTARSLPTG